AALSPEKVAQFKVNFAAYEDAFPPATVADYVDSITYAVNLLGIEHVTISSDMEHGGGIAGWMDAGEAFRVTEELVSRGYTEDQIAKLWWLNFARMWRAVEAVANES
ncbi:MAG: membrane dipeptidase, partial [Rhodospirillales bacterium]